MQSISDNIKRLRKLKNLSQKEIALSVDIPQGQYSRIESGKVTPTIPTLKKIADVFEVSLAELVREGDLEDINVSLLEKVQMIELLDEDEKNALLKIIDVALSKKKLKDNLNSLAAS
ncbi:MAG: helix-turn-helix transcriptional regulator [Bacteroidota bacterium]